MILSDFQSRQKQDNSNLHEIIPISFHMHSILHDKYYNIGNPEKYLLHTWSQAKSSGIKLPEVHSVSESLGLNIQPEKAGHKTFSFKSKLNFTNKTKNRTRDGRIKMKEASYWSTDCSMSKTPIEIPEVPKVKKQVINIPNFAPPGQSISNPIT